jgi:hypothetical protein
MKRPRSHASPVVINRARAPTLWAAIVAERPRFDRDEARKNAGVFMVELLHRASDGADDVE